jgi:hypothetical protein
MEKSLYIFKLGIILTGLLFSSASQALYLYGDDDYTLNGSDAFVFTYDSSTLTITEFAGASHVNAYDQSTINVQSSGSFSHFSTYDQTTANIYGGNYSFLNVLGESEANVYDFGTTSWFLLGLDAQLNIYGEDLSYDNGYVRGLSSSGYHYGFRVQSVDEYGMILDGIAENVMLNPVPLPAAFWLFWSGLIGLLGVARRKT